MQKSVLIYARYSTDLQNDETIEAQFGACADYAEKQGWVIVARYEDRAISGTSFNQRPGMKRMLEAIKRDPPDILLCTAIDRLSRDPEHTAKIHKLLKHHRVALYTTHGGQPSDLEIGLRSALNAEFIAETARKTRDGMRHAVRKGKAAAGLAYGYKVALVYDERGERVPGYRQIDDQQAPIVLRIFEEYAAGISPQKIAARLNAEAVPFPGKRGGKAWRDSTIRGSRTRGLGILNNETYIGRMIWNRQSFSKNPETEKRVSRMNPEEVWEVREMPDLQIVPVDLWNRVRRRQQESEKQFDRTKTNRLNRSHRPLYLLSGLLECAECGGPYAIMAKDRYGCTNYRKKVPLEEIGGRPCSNPRTVLRREVERRVTSAFPESIFAASNIEQLQRDADKAAAASTAKTAVPRNELEKKLKATETKMRNLIARMAENHTIPMMNEILHELEAERRQQQAELDALPKNERIEVPKIVLSPSLLRTSLQAICDLSLVDQQSEFYQAWLNMARSLIQRVIIAPREPRGVSLEIHGRLATILASIEAWNREEKRIRAEQHERFIKQRTGGAFRTTQDRIDFMKRVEKELNEKRRSWERLQVSVVAGAGFEPATFRL